MRCHINACVGLLCAFTITVHLYLHTHQRQAPRPQLPAHSVPRRKRVSCRNMWDRRYAYSPLPPHNATVDDGLPQFAGTCAQSDDEPEDDALPGDQSARSLLLKSTQNRIRAELELRSNSSSRSRSRRRRKIITKKKKKKKKKKGAETGPDAS